MEKLERRGNLKGLEVSRISVMENHSQLTVTDSPPGTEALERSSPGSQLPGEWPWLEFGGNTDTVTESEHPS